MSPAERALHRWILEAFPRLGGAPEAAAIRGRASLLGLRAEEALAGWQSAI